MALGSTAMMKSLTLTFRFLCSTSFWEPGAGEHLSTISSKMNRRFFDKIQIGGAGLKFHETVLVGLRLLLFLEEYNLGINKCRRRDLLTAFQLGTVSKDWPLQEDRCITPLASK